MLVLEETGLPGVKSVKEQVNQGVKCKETGQPGGEV